MDGRARRLGAVAALVLVQACGGSGSSQPQQVKPGTWSSDGLVLVVTAAGGTAHFCCAIGSIGQPLTLDAAGHFQASGTYLYQGGPIPVGGNQPVPAQYNGVVIGSAMTLSVVTPSQTLGPYSLTFDPSGALNGCVCPL